ncbi:hypothetical protein [Halarsenatibacter silvermanii]|uniref:Uncharacterized protein n=1 Tax=Halarsenatibacter silvermanii TaxID=321763 RepID=A0A1G9T974_9FIRM|nr:hypothetical protein [Halarsenatibacter silvermanii]SDM43655.1 hypothetical protein SAMN04488692_13511 [Halarsenatibacter silvermanii]
MPQKRNLVNGPAPHWHTGAPVTRDGDRTSFSSYWVPFNTGIMSG